MSRELDQWYRLELHRLLVPFWKYGYSVLFSLPPLKLFFHFFAVTIDSSDSTAIM